MPRYFFNVHDGRVLLDTDGTELPGIEAAHREAVQLAGRLLVDQPNEFWNGEDWRVEVMNENQLLMFVLNFTATMAPAVFTG